VATAAGLFHLGLRGFGIVPQAHAADTVATEELAGKIISSGYCILHGAAFRSLQRRADDE
jgi:hypothetical protein